MTTLQPPDPRRPQRRRWGLALLFLLLPLLLLPPVRTRLRYYARLAQAQWHYWRHPPEAQVFQPRGPTPTVATAKPATPGMTATPWPSITPRPGTPPPRATPTQPRGTPTPTATPFIPPPRAIGPEPVHEPQGWNNCGPATLSMALRSLGWQGDQYALAPYLKPNPDDKNVFPWEMVRGVEALTPYRALWRPGGDVLTLRRLIAAGFPVIVETGLEVPGRFEGWMGHYRYVWGYSPQSFVSHDSYLGPNVWLSPRELEAVWWHFGNTFIVVYPPEREAEVHALLGELADMDRAWARLAARSRAVIDQPPSLRARVFAWFNLGEALVGLGQMEDAAAAFDQAFLAYANLPADQRPWRWMWYHEGPYRAYFAVGRYTDVIDLATKTLRTMADPVLEEAYYWRGRSYAALGQVDRARQDLTRALALHPGYQAAQAALDALTPSEP